MSRGPGLGVAAHRVEHDVHIGHVVVEPAVRVVDDVPSTEARDESGVAGRGGRGDPCAQRGGDLYGERADATGATVDEDMLAGLQVGSADQSLPCRERRQWYGRRAGVVQSGRFGGEDLGRYGYVLGGGPVTQEGDESVHLGTQGRSCDTGPVLDHDTGHLVRGNEQVSAPVRIRRSCRSRWRPGQALLR